MSAEEQQALYRAATALHEESSDEASLRKALDFYKKARDAASQTFPIAFRIGIVSHSLLHFISSETEAFNFRKSACS